MSNKLALEIKLKGVSTLEIKFLHWDKRFLSNCGIGGSNFVYFESMDGEFSIYSDGRGYIIDQGQFTLVVPGVERMQKDSVILHEFPNDDVRYQFLKSMYEYLPEWANTWERFKNDQKMESNMLVHNHYWVF